MDSTVLQELLDSLIAGWENEVVEFKDVGDSYRTSNIGKYLSALANEANLRGVDTAWLIFGVENRTRAVTDSSYRRDRERLDSLKMQMTEGTSPAICFREIHELQAAETRVVLFEIPPAPRGIPIAWNGHYYARAGESLVPLPLDRLDVIRNQTGNTDWTAEIVAEATVDHLDSTALKRAKENFAKKHANRFEAEEVLAWSDTVFLDRARLTRENRITKTALLLLGRPESAHLLSPHIAQIVWKLVGPEKGDQIFGPPFLLNSTALYQKIRNVQIRILPDDQLIAIEVAKYDQKVVLEALHNCIAHQNYHENSRIVVTEHLDRLIFKSVGSFFEGNPADYVAGTKTPSQYRNPFLVQAMAELNMIDTMGYGIHEIYRGQAERCFPLPDYDPSCQDSVSLTIYGTIVDPAYSRLLIGKTDLSLSDIVALDRVQKGFPLADDVTRQLRRRKLIEGRKPNLHISAAVAAVTGNQAEYIRALSQTDAHFSKLVLDYLGKFKSASRADIDSLLMPILSDGLDDGKKRNKIANLLTNLRRDNKIENSGTRKVPKWIIPRAIR